MVWSYDNNVVYTSTMVREQEQGRSGNNVVVALEVAKTLNVDISCSMRDIINKMGVATRVTMATMPFHFIPNMLGKNK